MTAKRLAWRKVGSGWTGEVGPVYVADMGNGDRVLIQSRRWRCGERGRRGYLTLFAVALVCDGQREELGQRNTLADAKALAEEGQPCR